MASHPWKQLSSVIHWCVPLLVRQLNTHCNHTKVPHDSKARTDRMQWMLHVLVLASKEGDWYILRFSQRCSWGFWSSGMWRSVAGLGIYNILKDCVAFIFTGQGVKKKKFFLNCLTLKIKVLHSCEKSQITNPATRCHIPEDVNHQHDRCHKNILQTNFRHT
jgi:hypothetical protein